MATLEGHHVDAGSESRCHYRHSATGSSGMSLSGDSDDQSWHSPLEIEGVSESQRDSSESDCLCEKDLESGVLEVKVHLGKVERDCRICHLGLEDDIEAGVPIELGCACKGDLGAAHKQCAETWFKIKGNATCEICGATALNVAGEQRNEANNAATAAAASTAFAAPVILVETRTIWHGRRIMNFLLACMVLGFVISWLFHFKILT
ncbi:uncharacterized protein LOC108998441 isoform X2 [Juglans regia]|uniref:Uncharacterized protein LOC108998441 isoform X2 n=1 Tax=Juglans regia TaxID=51240 RepID=A0A6P9DZ46_JUGRE|nr:uncharacterized protein LOC118343710 isoform X2 [Juglans regia]XP_035541028.1 uncharacterized protein LOC108998441 isoform X2 [Juglans regia]